MANETWRYTVEITGNPVMLKKNTVYGGSGTTSAGRVIIKRTYPSGYVDTSRYEMVGTTGYLSTISGTTITSYNSPTNPQLKIGVFGTTSVLEKDSNNHSLSDVPLMNVSKNLLQVGTSGSDTTTLEAICSNAVSTNIINIYKSSYDSVSKFEITVEVKQTVQVTTGTVPSNVYIGSSFNIALSNDLAEAVTTSVVLRPDIDTSKSASGTVNAAQTNATITVPSAWASLLSTTSSTGGTVTVYTYVNGNQIGSVEYKTTINISDTSVPTIDVSVSMVDHSHNNFATGKGIYIQGVTGINISVQATAPTGAAISSYTFSASQGSFTKSQNTYYADIITVSGYITFDIRVTDSRGKSATTTESIYVYPYKKPTISGTSAIRCNSTGTASEEGTHAKIRATATASTIYIDGANTNSVTLRADYYRATAGEPSTSQLLASMTNNTDYLVNGNFSPLYQYYIRFVATDNVSGSVYFDVSMSSASFAMHIHNGGTGVAFGKTSDTDNQFEITDAWLPKWGQFILPGIYFGDTAPTHTPSSTQVGSIIWLKPKAGE